MTNPEQERSGGRTEQWAPAGSDERRHAVYGVRDGTVEDFGPGDALKRVAKGLGWLSLAVGASAVLVPRLLLGQAERRDAGRLGRRVWSRRSGEAIDLSPLRRALGSRPAPRGRATTAAALVGGLALVGTLAGRRLTQRGEGREEGEIRTSITINRSPAEVYNYWHNFENLPRFMKHLEAVETMAPGRSRWQAKAPLGQSVSWEAEIVEDRPNELIAWRSLPGAQVHNEGVVTFRPAPGGRGTEVGVRMRYDPPAGKVGQVLAQIFGEEPRQQVPGDLRRFKQLMETGEVLVSDTTLDGTGVRQPAAQPPKEEAA